MTTKITAKSLAATPGQQTESLYTLLVELVDRLERLEVVVNEQIVTTTTKNHEKAPEQLVSSPDATALASAITLVNELKADYVAHIADAAAHDNADATNTVSAADATDLATAITLANELKTDLVAHGTQANVHFTNHTVTVSAANASDLATLLTLVNELKVDLNDHLAESRSKGIRAATLQATSLLG